MAVATAVGGSYIPYEFRRSVPSLSKIAAQIKPTTIAPPLFISTNVKHVNLHHLRDLYAICNHSCHRYPTVDSDGRVDPVDILKLQTALSHSSVVVSVFTKPEFLAPQPSTASKSGNSVGIGGDWIRRVTPVNPENGWLIGFGRAVSDLGLTASIYDVIVHPALQGRGIGKKIVNRILRILTHRDIYDISALCTEKQRLFFSKCGFEDNDGMGSITMMYTRSVKGCPEDEKMIRANKKQL
ncbi:uncharacterized N-acetyltransferase ycf52 [Andrographis paniculata]|uniref:uncharacterized N-acetyltransferase ycf52 n=1 Tax=Andrographis paniculata TaxID=175694 RepID=UPI0021E99757|nr:uncharacterized N-acetyltransferase ycf52 [Andrographis paniculata]